MAAKEGHITNLGHYPKKLLETAMSMLPETNVKNASEARVTAVQGAIGKIYMAFDLPQPSFSPVATFNLMDTAYDYKVEAYRHYSIHGDHLGSSSYVTDPTGAACQHMEYLPFGETLVDEHLNSINSPFKYNGKEYDDETGNYYYGARYYDPKWSVWTSVDPLAEKYPNISSYAYVANNPVNAIDPNGKDIIFLTRNNDGTIKEKYTYRNGNFYHQNGTRYNPGKESVSKTMYKVLTAYRIIEKSNDKILKGQLHALEKSERHHFVEQSPNEENAVSSLEPDLSYFGKPASTQTEFDFEITGKDPLLSVVHEMRHQYDHEIGNMKDDADINDANDPSEIRAVNNENRANDILGLPRRTTYDSVKIDPKKLVNPPNNIQPKDEKL